VLSDEADPELIAAVRRTRRAKAANHGGRPAVIDPDSLIYARALRDAGTPVPKIAGKLTIKTGNNASHHPSVYRALAVPGTTT